MKRGLLSDGTPPAERAPRCARAQTSVILIAMAWNTRRVFRLSWTSTQSESIPCPLLHTARCRLACWPPL